MNRDVVGLVALDFVLWIIRARVMSVSLVIDVFCTHLNDLAADMAGLRVPGHVVPYFEFCGHDKLPSVIAASQHAVIPVLRRLRHRHAPIGRQASLIQRGALRR